MGRVAGKKIFSIMALCAMIGLLLLPIAVSLPVDRTKPTTPGGRGKCFLVCHDPLCASYRNADWGDVRLGLVGY